MIIILYNIFITITIFNKYLHLEVLKTESIITIKVVINNKNYVKVTRNPFCIVTSSKSLFNYIEYLIL